VRSPNARFIQWKAEFAGNAILDSATLAYLPQNPAGGEERDRHNAACSFRRRPARRQPQPATAYSITVTDTGEAGTTTSAGTPTQNLARAGAVQIQVSWQAKTRTAIAWSTPCTSGERTSASGSS